MVILEKRISSSFYEVDLLVKEAVVKLKEMNDPNVENLLFKINFMLREILNNAVEHGNKFSSEKMIDCSIEYDRPLIIFKVSDEGTGIKDYRNAENGEVLRTRMRGIEAIRAMEFEFSYSGSEVTVVVDLHSNNYSIR